MKAKLNFFVAAVLSLAVFCPPAFAEWTEPAPLAEVNTEYHEKSPFLSFDGLTLYFARAQTYNFYSSRMYQATRAAPAGPFTSIKEIGTLLLPGGGVDYPWVSADNLRMYYFYKQPVTSARLAISERGSVDDLWLPGDDLVELNVLGDIFNPSLTEDELTIFFTGYNLKGGKGAYDLWMAARPDVTSPFGNVTNLAEINSSASDLHPAISPDGLILYFASDRNGTAQLFKATRQSLGSPFGNVEQLSFFDSPDASVQYPRISSDGNAFYFVKSTNEQTLDIYVSYFYAPEPNKWSQPVPLTEVNTKYEEWAPFLSLDGLTLYFSRVHTDISSYGRIYQASRDEPSGPFTSLREISELNESNASVVCPWISPDYLRMYYAVESYPQYQLRVSDRPSVNDPWPKGTGISELNALADFIHTPKLTADELVIFFAAYNLAGGRGRWDIWMATRPDTNTPFVQVRNLDEINTGSDEAHPFVSPDGLKLYFTSDRNGNFQLFKATRESLAAPFGNLEHLSFFDTPGGHSLFPCLSSDGNTFYFVRQVGVASTRDIWVSYSSEIPPVPEPNIYYVDGVNGNDNNNGLTPQTAFATIQKGINTAGNKDTVLVYPALYREGVDFLGKAITVQGVATSAGVPIIENPGDFAVSFYNGEEPNSIFKNFVVQNSFIALFIASSSPTISNLTIVGNNYGVKCYAGSDPAISNCIFWNNTEADLVGCQVFYSRTEQTGEGNIDEDPLFADANNGDYHLLSSRGRYWPEHDVWVLDKVTSPCVDGGDPAVDPSGEPMPNGGRIDIGAYGGTPFASMSDWPIAGDVNHDGVVDLADLAIFCNEWLSALPWAE